MQRTILLATFFAFYLTLSGQSKEILPYIQAWKKTGTGQSYAAQVFFDSLRVNKQDPQKIKQYENDINELRRYLKQYPDRRLEVRLMMFEIIAGNEFGRKQDRGHIIDEAIKKAYPLDDNQLNAELYSLKADNASGLTNATEIYLLFNLKAIDIQRKTGFKYFPFLQNRFFGVSYQLYKQWDYEQAIYYAKEGLRVWHLDSIHRDPMVYIFLCDIAGACYKKLGKYDSSRVYYSELLRRFALEKDGRAKKLWSGIGNGNLGIAYTHEGDYAKAYPLLTEYLNGSSELHDSLNIAIAQTAFAWFYYKQKKYSPALSSANAAFQIAKLQNNYNEIIDASGVLAAIYRAKKEVDSAFYYYEQEQQYKDLVRAGVRKSELSVMQARIAFDELQYSFKLARTSAIKEKKLRNTILICVVLFTVIALLLYSRRAARKKYELKEIQLKREQAEHEAREAREKVAIFANNLVEKNNLISSLKKQLVQNEISGSATLEHLLAEPLLTDEGWEKFRSEFSKAYPFFFANLQKEATDFTPAMERLSALIFLGLSNSQIGNTLGIGKDSVARSKRRLKALLRLGVHQSVEEYITGIAG
ncbi:MAG TPA: tetratricopeptide repeat protein [Niabella sp.]|nr:tetratricopeptide repeat protein [Niabella sp.]